MTGLLKTAAVTLATVLTAAATSAQAGVSIWLEFPHNARPQGGIRYDHHPRHTQPAPRHYQPRYEPRAETPAQKCNRAIFNQRDLDIYLPRTGVGFIEGHSYACRINFNTNTGIGRLARSYNRQTDAGNNGYENAKAAAYDREFPIQYGQPRHH